MVRLHHDVLLHDNIVLLRHVDYPRLLHHLQCVVRLRRLREQGEAVKHRSDESGGQQAYQPTSTIAISPRVGQA